MFDKVLNTSLLWDTKFAFTLGNFVYVLQEMELCAKACIDFSWKQV